MPSPADTFSIVPHGDREIIIRRSFRAPRQLVFDAWTRPELIRRWQAGPEGWVMTVCDVDLRVGGRVRFEWTRPESGMKMGLTGIYQDVVVPVRLVCAETFDEDWTGGEALSTLVFTEADGLTTTTNTIRYRTPEGRALALQSGMESGMAEGYRKLDEILATLGPD